MTHTIQPPASEKLIMPQPATINPAVDLPRTMRAIVAYGPDDYRLEEVEVPRAGPDDIIIEVEACGVCASEIKTFHGAQSLWGGAARVGLRPPSFRGMNSWAAPWKWARTWPRRANSRWGTA